MPAPSLRARDLSQSLRSSLWFLPTVAVAIASVTAVLLSDVRIADDAPLARVLFHGDAEGARGMLQAIAGSVITVTGLVFSLTLVTLQLASSQFSPRLLRTFERDRGNQVVLAVFLATFAYSLAVLRTIGGGRETVPEVAVTGAFVMAMASVAALVYYINHAVSEIRVDTMMRDVERDTKPTIERLYPADQLPAGELDEIPVTPYDARMVDAAASGFVQDVDIEALARHAAHHDVTVRLHERVGSGVVQGGPMAWVWGPGGAAPADSELEAMRRHVHAAVQIGHERTQQGDVAFGLRQLADVAVKALSPAVNDPTTAVHAIDRLASLLAVLVTRRLGPLIGEEAGVARVFAPGMSFADYLDLACGQIRRFGAGEPAAMTALLVMLRQVAVFTSDPRRRRALGEQAAMIVTAAERHTDEPHDLIAVRAAAATVDRALSGDHRP